jgi:PadR family transcriptional regulator PadR
MSDVVIPIERGDSLDNTAISSDVIRGYIDLMILKVLCDGDSYGYEISKKITEISGGVYTMKETTLYSAFSRLEKLLAVRSYPGTVSGGRERTYYNLTEEGRRYYRQKCDEWAMTKTLITKFILEEVYDGSN